MCATKVTRLLCDKSLSWRCMNVTSFTNSQENHPKHILGMVLLHYRNNIYLIFIFYDLIFVFINVFFNNKTFYKFSVERCFSYTACGDEEKIYVEAHHFKVNCLWRSLNVIPHSQVLDDSAALHYEINLYNACCLKSPRCLSLTPFSAAVSICASYLFLRAASNLLYVAVVTTEYELKFSLLQKMTKTEINIPTLALACKFYNLWGQNTQK